MLTDASAPEVHTTHYFEIISETDLPSGHHILSFEFEPTGGAEPMKGIGTPGTITLFVDGEQVGWGELPVTVPIVLGLGGGVAVGRDAGAPVTQQYQSPDAFTGSLTKVVFDVSGEHVVDHEAEFRIAIARR